MGASAGNEEKVVSDWLRDALESVHRKQPELWQWGVGERARVGQIFRALYETDPFLGGWDIDLEWNREGAHGGPKRQPENSSGYGTPDIAVHHRGKKGTEHNLLIVEFKNVHSHGRTNYRDRRKVRWWMEEFSYRFGAVIALGPSLQRFRPAGTWLTLDEHGKPIERPWH
ncbi:hypothetical protein Achl_4234 (plasmid) [Pseudarthrobacter chlorophenolicus A6]|uniref:Uncharacterized protein n=1 Tax=Pseudarthrobacter chlorophenolicus (strain ATCC 700700 / DSM 12829 / CIP 107037 / JCM 12360 / KCTC 9906 / NCIMB 13794 / A6) TaxID=452863 RepID=B8HID8_PSECP|nr:hypothetical protein [Pseudarthrobacter chlorophenolicus]ACL42185.1 hypothetical protein Achl_4234 [Pseudarthrobacter chlorophenolicus A6]SDQ14558.1 hypothetical protein SAMN04489738_0292 [Pseudarthrobacter chlorophenolicus]